MYSRNARRQSPRTSITPPTRMNPPHAHRSRPPSYQLLLLLALRSHYCHLNPSQVLHLQAVTHDPLRLTLTLLTPQSPHIHLHDLPHPCLTLNTPSPPNNLCRNFSHPPPPPDEVDQFSDALLMRVKNLQQ